MCLQIASLLITNPRYWIWVVLIIFAVFCVWNRIETSLMSQREKQKEEEFWEREQEANSVRRKSLDSLTLVTVSEALPYDLHNDDEEIKSFIETVNILKTEKIANLTGYTNTDLKFKYGAPNITELTRYDNNFTSYVTTLNKWAERLLQLNEEAAAVSIYEYLVSINADITKVYKFLGERYSCTFDSEKLDKLIESANELKSLNKKTILNELTKQRAFLN